MSESEESAGGPRKTGAWAGELGRQAEGTFPDALMPDEPPQATDDLSGTVLAERYRVLEKIGQGGMGEVYLGQHVTINKKVAIKVLSQRYKGRRDIIGRFLQEARAASSIRHENVVDITDFGETTDGLVFLVMEYLEGRELSSAMEAATAMPWTRAREILLQILDALGAAHAGGVIHRDMKPDNCFVVQRTGNRDFIKVLDFGIAKITNEDDAESLTRTGVIMGTANYMSPEQAHGDRLDARTDLYSCGVILYEMITGRLPFSGNNPMSVMYKHLHTEPLAPRAVAPECNIPAAVEAVVLRALQKSADLRYQSAQEFASALRELSEVPVEATAPAVGRRAHARTGRWLAAAAVVVVAAGVGVFAATSDDDADTATALAAAATTPTVAQRTVVSAPEGDAPARAAVPLEPAPAPALAPEDTSVPPASSAGAASEGAEKVDVAKVPRRPSTSRSTKEIRKTLRRQVEAGAKRCLEKEGAFAGERVDVNFTIDPDGSVKAARAGRKHANTPMGQCVEQAVRDASFSEASEPQTVEHAFSL